MPSAICFNFDQSKILSSVNGLKSSFIDITNKVGNKETNE